MAELLHGFSIEALGGGSAVIALVVFFLLWRVFKMAVKIVLFIVVMAALAAGVAIYLKVSPHRAGAGLQLPVPHVPSTP